MTDYWYKTLKSTSLKISLYCMNEFHSGTHANRTQIDLPNHCRKETRLDRSPLHLLCLPSTSPCHLPSPSGKWPGEGVQADLHHWLCGIGELRWSQFCLLSRIEVLSQPIQINVSTVCPSPPAPSPMALSPPHLWPHRDRGAPCHSSFFFEKLEAVCNWPQPSTLKQLQHLLWFANFISDYSSIAAPLTALTKPSGI